MKFRDILITVAVIMTTLGCGVEPPPPAPDSVPVSAGSFRIVAGSEVKTLEGILNDFTKSTSIPLALTYKGSVDIRNMVAAYTASNPGDVDAFWAASPIWLSPFVREQTSVMRTYIVLGVDKSLADGLGWNPRKGIVTADVIAAIRANKLKLAMPSASQDDAGAIFYLAFLSSLKGGVVQTEDLKSASVVEGVKTLFGGVSRSAASAEAVRQLFTADRLSAKQFNAVVLPESIAIAANQELKAKGAEPITIFYVLDAVNLQTFPIGYVEKSSPAKVDQFNRLVAYLKSPEVKERLKGLGWRVGYVGMKVENPDPAVFNPAWGIETQTDFPPITLPKEAVIDEALNLYQTAFRKASYTIYCLDYSGSMGGKGEEQMKNAMDLLLDQTRASRVLLQATGQDHTTVLRFDDSVRDLGAVTGGDAATLKNLSRTIRDARPSGGTAMFLCAQNALNRIAGRYEPGRYNYAVVALTDGQSNVGPGAEDFKKFYASKNLPVPVFGIALGAADMRQLEAFKTTGGEVCDGTKGEESLVLCFRRAKGSN